MSWPRAAQRVGLSRHGDQAVRVRALRIRAEHAKIYVLPMLTVDLTCLCLNLNYKHKLIHLLS